MNKKEEEIQRKLVELETTVLKEQADIVTSNASAGTNLTNAAKKGHLQEAGSYGVTSGGGTAPLNRSDGYYFGGVGLLVLGLFLVFTHVRVGNGFLAMMMGGGSGLVFFLLPLLIGISMMVYNGHSKWGRIITALSCVMLLMAILFTLTFSFPSLTLMQTIMMFLPFAIGGAFVVKGMGGPEGVKNAIKDSFAHKDHA